MRRYTGVVRQPPAQRRSSAIGTLILALTCAMSPAQAQQLFWLGSPYGDASAASIASDFRLVGFRTSSSGQPRAFLWDPVNSLRELGTLGGASSTALDLSFDGLTVVGQAQNSQGQPRAFYWTAETGMRDLGTFGGSRATAWGVSADGAVIVGGAFDAQGRERAFRWTQVTGMTLLGTLGGASSVAFDVSLDGSLIVGQAQNAQGWNRAFYWTAATGMRELPVPPIVVVSTATAVSGDGTVVGGHVQLRLLAQRAVRWVQAEWMEFIDPLLGGERHPHFVSAVSADGSALVGHMLELPTLRGFAYRWTANTGTQDLNREYREWIADLRNGSRLSVARGVSSDGRFVVGQGYNAATGRNEAFLLDVKWAGDVDEDGAVTSLDEDLVIEAVWGFRECAACDVDGDEDVDTDDWQIVMLQLGFRWR